MLNWWQIKWSQKFTVKFVYFFLIKYFTLESFEIIFFFSFCYCLSKLTYICIYSAGKRNGTVPALCHYFLSAWQMTASNFYKFFSVPIKVRSQCTKYYAWISIGSKQVLERVANFELLWKPYFFHISSTIIRE